MQKIIFFLLLGISCVGQAACPMADAFLHKNNLNAFVYSLHVCAVNYNDDESQMKLAQAYLKGEYGLTRDTGQVLYFYQLAAEAGNAEAQLALAEAFIRADQASDTRDVLLNYRKKLELLAGQDEAGSFNGDFVHPYALLMLASESADKKWYYPSQVRNAPPKAISMLQTYNISPEKKREAIRQASQFKTRKLLQTAREVLSADEYSEMEGRLKNPQTQAQALQELKQKMEEYIRFNKEIRKAK